jgi:hypothetical protein
MPPFHVPERGNIAPQFNSLLSKRMSFHPGEGVVGTVPARVIEIGKAFEF